MKQGEREVLIADSPISNNHPFWPINASSHTSMSNQQDNHIDSFSYSNPRNRSFNSIRQMAKLKHFNTIKEFGLRLLERRFISLLPRPWLSFQTGNYLQR